MGKVVAAMASVHAPQLFTRPPEEDPRQLDAGVAAMRKLGKVLDETKPDALIIFASDHMETFFLKSVPTFAVVAGERAKAAFAGKTWEPPIHQPLAEHILDQLVRREFDMAYDEGGVFQLTMHPHIIGYRSRIWIIDEMIRHAKSRPGVWFGTHAEVVDWAKQHAA